MPKYLFACLEYIYACTNILRLPHKHFGVPQIFEVLPQKFIHFPRYLFAARKYFQGPGNFLLLPGIYYVLCADFLFSTILGVPWCRDYVIDLLLAASALQAEFQT